MSDIAATLAAEISEDIGTLIDEVIREQYKRHPELEKRYGRAGMQRCREDIDFHFCTLIEALATGERNLFVNYVAWGKVVLVNRRVRLDDLIDTLTIMQEVLTKKVRKPTAAAAANRYIQTAIDRFDSFPNTPPSYIDPCAPMQKQANSYLQALLSVDRDEARRIIRIAVQSGTRVQDVYRYIFEPVQREVGRLWQMNHISVAQEHYCTASTEMLMGELAREREEAPRGPHFFLGTCVAGAQHSLGIRMLSELLETSGWKVYFTGANTPSASLVELIDKFHIDVLGISAATAMDLPQVRKLIEAVRNSKKENTKIMVGGRVFNEFPALWKKLGADAWSKDAVSGVNVAYKLVDGKTAKPSRLTARKPSTAAQQRPSRRGRTQPS
jgi:MerR family transcriptional regulator, light-induced transcriptional regulator